MNDKHEKIFDQIAQDALQEAAEVKVPLDEYLEGLEMIREEITMAIDAAKSDLERQGSRNRSET
jgi:hypothetical protein